MQNGVGLFSDNKKSAALMNVIKPVEIQVPAIHGDRLLRVPDEDVQDVYIVNFAIGDFDESGDIAAQIQERMKFYSGLGAAEVGPWKQRKT